MFSLIIPTYNERDNIVSLLVDIESTLTGLDHEIIVVDDDSPDQTWQLVQEFQFTSPNVHLLRRFNKRGLSSAVIDGFRKVSGDVLGVIDADHSHDFRLLPKMIELIRGKQAECVVGSRRVSGGGSDKWPWHRKASSNLATSLAALMTKVSVKDPMSGFFCISRDVVNKAISILHPSGYKILLELLVKARPNKVIELPYIFIDRKQGYSKLSVRVALAFLFQLQELFWYRFVSKS
ncbi:MAG: polyprenol monophosphomannose synthase [Candidatus Omnitrophica bacterium]|nr:polyprenol monophosphomannose synthase [Candidatus Omnitrophota bacterium]